MVEKTRNETPGDRVTRDRTIFLLLLGVCVLVRIPFLRAFDLVTYDGTHYINQAKSMLGMSPSGGAFPLGYPACIALLLPVVRDGVRAAQLVSLAAGIGSVWLLYALGKTIVSQRSAVLAALLLAVTPLFVRLSLSTLSESVFIFWVLLGFYLFVRCKDLRFGLSMGMAAVTRPEGLGVFLVLVVILALRKRPWSRLAIALAGFLVLYAANVVALSLTLDRLVLGDTRFALVRRTQTVGRTATSWQGREVWADFEDRESYERVLESGESANVLIDGAKRFPGELVLLGRHVMPVAMVLALYGVYRRRLFILAGFVPFVFVPFFSSRSDPRYILLYVPIVLLFAALGLDHLREGKRRWAGGVLLIVSVVAGLFVNKDQLVEPVSDGFQWAKRAGLGWRERIGPGERVADRKPFFAFYAGAKYVEIPIAPYEETIRYLVTENVRFLMLHGKTIEVLRPALVPLLNDRALIRGELRFRQADLDPGVYALYERTGAADPLTRRRITRPSGGVVVVPSWSPDGAWIAYRSMGPADSAGVFVVPADGGETRCVVSGPEVIDPVTWSPDSRRIALAARSENGDLDIRIIDVSNAKAERFTTDAASDRSPNWSTDGSEIVFCSNRTGSDEIWAKTLATDREIRITMDGGNTYPALSPKRDRVAWVSEREGLVVLDRISGRRTRLELPKKTSFAPSWSPDGRFIAVTAEADGGVQVYILTSDGGEALMLTKSTAGNGMPCWSPDGARMAVATNEEGDYGLWVLGGLDTYLDRLATEYPVRLVEPSQ